MIFITYNVLSIAEFVQYWTAYKPNVQYFYMVRRQKREEFHSLQGQLSWARHCRLFPVAELYQNLHELKVAGIYFFKKSSVIQ